MTRQFICILLVAAFAVSSASARQQAEPELISDRPDFTESAVVIPRGMVQLEAGLTYENFANADVVTVGEALVRFPLSSRVEARLGLPNYFSNGISGFTDSSVGAKVQLGPTSKGLDLGVIGGVSLPTGEDGLTSDSVDPFAIFTGGKQVSDKVSLGAQIGASLPERADSREVDLLATLVAGFPLSDQLGGFAEIAGFFPESGDETFLLHAGITYPVHPGLQLDLHGGTGLTDEAADLFIGAGFVYRR